MKVRIYNTVRIVQEFDSALYPGSTPEQIVQENVEQDDEERWEAVEQFVQDNGATSFTTTVLVFGDDEQILAKGSVRSGENEITTIGEPTARELTQILFPNDPDTVGEQALAKYYITRPRYADYAEQPVLPVIDTD